MLRSAESEFHQYISAKISNCFTQQIDGRKYSSPNKQLDDKRLDKADSLKTRKKFELKIRKEFAVI